MSNTPNPISWNYRGPGRYVAAAPAPRYVIRRDPRPGVTSWTLTRGARTLGVFTTLDAAQYEAAAQYAAEIAGAS